MTSTASNLPADDDFFNQLDCSPSFNDPLPNFPKALKEIPNWVLWRMEPREGRETKVPYQAKTRSGEWVKALPNDPTTWTTFTEARKAFGMQSLTAEKGLGLTHGTPEQPVWFITYDLDACRNPETGEVAPWAEKIVREHPTYTELTPSSMGFRMYFRKISPFSLPNGGPVQSWEMPPLPGLKTDKRAQLEVFHYTKYVTVTGAAYGNIREIADYDGFLSTLPYTPKPAVTIEPDSLSPLGLSEKEEETLNKLLSGGKTCGDHSKDDFHACCLLAKKFGSDASKIDSAIRASKLYRPKWNRKDYRSGTIKQAIESVIANDCAHEAPIKTEEAKQVRPQLPEGALYGLAGHIIRKLTPQTEAHPAGMLVDLLTQFGSIIGRTAYYQIEDTKHYANLFAVRVGLSSKSRKGTAAARIRHLYESVSTSWSANCQYSGLQSGEGIVHAMRDERLDEKGHVVDGGAKDKRMFVYESEFAGPLNYMKKENSILSVVIRNGWDGRVLQLLNKNTPEKASNGHLSIVGDITKDELSICLRQADQFNGFANRFLWVHVERGRLLPDGGQEIDWSEEVTRLRSAVEFSSQQKRVFMDRNAREKWYRAYEALAKENPGLLGAVTSRGEAQVVRLALIYALLDKSTHILKEHLDAALALWEYCEESARFIFGGGLTPDQNKIVAWLKEKKASGDRWQLKTAINRWVFNNHGTMISRTRDLLAVCESGDVIVKIEDGRELFSAK
jgi:hypothetical protein